jgi:hypothetical protein
MATVVSEVTIKVRAYETPAAGTATGLGARSMNHAFDFFAALATGVAANQCDLVYSYTGSTAIAQTYDLNALTSQMDGVAVPMVKLKGLFVYNKSATTGQYLTVGAGSNPIAGLWAAAGDGAKVGPSSPFVLCNFVDGVSVVNATGDILTVTPATGTIAYDILLIGSSS